MARAMRRANRPSPLSVNSSTSCVLVVLVDHVGRRATGGRIHPHVERGIPPVGEPPLGHVELRGAHPEVEERAAQPSLHQRGPQLVLDLGHHLGQGVEPRLADDGPSPEGGEDVGRRRHCGGIAVDPEHADLGMGLQDGGRMPAAAHGGVEDQAGRDRGEQPHHLLGHHRFVREGLAHPQSPDRHDACGWSAAAISLEVGGGGCFQGSGRGTAHGPDTFDVHLVPGHGGQARLVGCRSAPAVRAPERRRLVRRRRGDDSPFRSFGGKA